MRWFWPFRKRILTPEQIEAKEWRDYRNRIAHELIYRGCRGDPVSVDDAYTWADEIVARAQAQREAWRAEDAR